MNLEEIIEAFDVVAETKSGLEELRSLVLGLAIRGKLTEQDPNDEPASELLERIKAEKQRLYKAGEISKPKELAPIKDEETPFKIPNNWEWVRLGQISSRIQYGYTASAKSEIDYPKMLRITDIQNHKVKWEKVPGCNIKESEFAKFELKQGDILIARTGGTIGKSYLMTDVKVKSVFASYLIRIEPTIREIAYYIVRFLNSKLYWQQLDESKTGTGQPNVNATKLSNLNFPLPPIEAQRRIVNKVEELFSQIDSLESQLDEQNQIDNQLQVAVQQDIQEAQTEVDSKAAWNLITQHFDSLFKKPEDVDNLKKHILSEAVRGRLVEQAPNDEPASELLKRIKAEKQRLYKEGEIRKPKELEPIKEDEVPFEIPESWEWTSLNESGIVNPRNRISDNLDISFVPMKKISENFNEYFEYETRKWEQVKKGFTHFAENDVGVAKITPCFENGKSTVFNNLKNGYGAGTTELHIFRPISSQLVDPHFVYIFLNSSAFRANGREKMTGTAGQQRVPKSYFANTPFPLPPTNEQERIVHKIQEVFRICDLLKEKLQKGRQFREELEKGIVYKAL